MKKKYKTIVTLSSLPKRVSNDGHESVRLTWNKASLVERIQYALSLCCDAPVVCHVEFVDELQIATLNWQFRGKDSATDVLSFPPHRESLYSFQVGEPVHLGELAVCLDVCWRQAKKHRVTLSQEIEKMILHGLIHLKGFDHERSDAAYAVMTALERSVRTQLVKQLGSPEFCAPETKSKQSSTSLRVRR